MGAEPALLLSGLALEVLGGVEGALLAGLGVESVLDEFVEAAEVAGLLGVLELFIAEPVWREAAAPEAVPVLSGAEVMSPVSLREQPANAMKLAANSANSFIDLPCSFPAASNSEITPEFRLAFTLELSDSAVLSQRRAAPISACGPFGCVSSAEKKITDQGTDDSGESVCAIPPGRICRAGWVEARV